MNSVKCPECGLINWSTVPECKRCGALIATGHHAGNCQPASARYSLEKDVRVEPLFTGVIVLLTALLGLTVVICLVQQVFQPFSPDMAKQMAVFFALSGLVLMVLAHFWLLIRIFEQSVGWGLGSLFIPIVMLFAVGQFWHKTRRSFVGQFLCVGIFMVGMAIGY